MNGHDDWLARRARSGDWMVEQAVHVWDVFGWLKGGAPRPRLRPRPPRPLRPTSSPAATSPTTTPSSSNGPTASTSRSPRAGSPRPTTPSPGSSQRVVGSRRASTSPPARVTYRDKSRPRQAIHPAPSPTPAWPCRPSSQPSARKRPAPPPVTLAEAREATADGPPRPQGGRRAPGGHARRSPVRVGLTRYGRADMMRSAGDRRAVSPANGSGTARCAREVFS